MFLYRQIHLKRSLTACVNYKIKPKQSKVERNAKKIFITNTPHEKIVIVKKLPLKLFPKPRCAWAVVRQFYIFPPQNNMRGKREFIFLMTSLALFVFDVVTDIAVADQYWSEGENVWFGLTVTFIILPLIIISAVANYQTQGCRDCRENWCSIFICWPIFICWSIFERYVTEFTQWKKTYWDNSPCGDNYNECNCPDCEQYRVAKRESNESAYEFAWIRFIETLTESTPQWCIQVYIMFRRWDFPSLAVLSTVVSLFSLAWSITTLEKARVTNEGHNFTPKAAGLYFLFQLVALVSRLFAIAAFAYAFKNAVFLALFGCWLCGSVLLTCLTSGYLMFTICCGDTRCCDPSLKTMCGKLLLSLPLTFYVSEAVLQSLGFESIWIQGLFFGAKSLENFFLVYMVVFQADAKHMSVLGPIAWSLVTVGLLFGTISLAVRYTLLNRNVQVHDNVISIQVQPNAQGRREGEQGGGQISPGPHFNNNAPT